MDRSFLDWPFGASVVPKIVIARQQLQRFREEAAP
jgi:hypothetical protein